MRKLLLLLLLIPFISGCDNKEDETEIVSKEFTFEFEDDYFDDFVMVIDVDCVLGFESLLDEAIRVKVIDRKINFSVNFEKNINWYSEKNKIGVKFLFFGNSTKARGSIFEFEPNNKPETKFIYINEYKSLFLDAMIDNGLL